MEALLEKLRAYGRFLELKDQLPHWESQIGDLKTRIRELKLNRDLKEIELSNLKDPNFFQRLFGRTEEKKEKLGQQVSQATAAWTAAKWELEDLEKRINAGKQELEALSGCREAYAQAKAEAQLTTIQEGQLMMEELAAFTPAALMAAQRILDALEDARPWMQKDALSKGVGQDNRKLACLAAAQRSAESLVQILGILPEGSANIGAYLRAPESYITAVTLETKQLDRLNNAISQVRETRNQLTMLQ